MENRTAPDPDGAQALSGPGHVSVDDPDGAQPLSGPGDIAVDDRAADPDADPYSVARAIALRQLTLMPRSRSELRTKMDQRNVPGDVADAVLDRLSEVGLVDDDAFARAWVRSRQSSRGLARRALAHELRRKGIDDDTAGSALAGVGPDDEMAAARDLVSRRLSATRRLERTVRTRRLVAMLARKGYPSGVAMRVVREALDAEA